MSQARTSLSALLHYVQVIKVKFDDGRDPLLYDVVQEGSLKRLSMALDIDLAAHAEELRKAKAELPTVSTEQIEEAAKASHEYTNGAGSWELAADRIKRIVRSKLAAGFVAVGLYIEGDA